MDLAQLIEKWSASAASERANKDSFLHDLCHALGVEPPHPKTGDPDRDRYVFEREAVLVHGGERHSVGFIDLYKHGHFLLEAKQGSDAGSKKTGTARRDTPAWHVAMQEAFGQALTYASTIEPPPPFLIVTDIGYCFDLYASFDGSRNYRKFPDALSARISLTSLANEPQHVETLRAIFTDPWSLDPARRSVRVTREIAGYLADLAKSLDAAKHPPETVAKFLMRCLFTMFAEDIGLLPRSLFADALKDRWIENPELFQGEVGELWRKMNEGGYLFGAGNIWRFNGGLFAEPVALPLTKKQLHVLGLAAQSNWADVEPAIFGTLLERALDPKERHRLGAHYTPRAYVERLVRPTIEEPLRAEWDNVRAQVFRLLKEKGDENRKTLAEARKIVHAFYDKLTATRVLDPACGSGNFLFVALDLFKRIENEVIELLDTLGDDRAIVTFGRMVTPQQFLGIEIKPWAKEIAELVLWIGWLQWQIRTRGYKSHPEEPILRDYHNIECRDAVLAYDEKVPLLDDEGRPVTRWDGETMKTDPITGQEVRDETARLPVWRFTNSRTADWPRAEFIVGNPPFIGNKRLRAVLGDGYVDALRYAHAGVPDASDYVMYWWAKAAETILDRRASAFGLITTNSITQYYNRRVVADFIQQGGHITLAVPDHPWVDSSDGANVRVAMTVGRVAGSGVLLSIVNEEFDDTTGEAVVIFNVQTGLISEELSVGPKVTGAKALQANALLCQQGVKLVGDGFLLTAAEVDRLGLARSMYLKPFLSNRDFVGVSRGLQVLDFAGCSELQVREREPTAYQRLYDTVRKFRAENKDRQRREKWWLFGRTNEEMRASVRGLQRFIVTPEVAKHRPFAFVDQHTVPDASLYVIGSSDGFVLGVLSSRLHITWALRAGGTLEDRPRYQSGPCFDPFPFPDPDEFTKQRIRTLGEALDAHRKRQQELHSGLTITGMYNVLEKLRGGEALTAKEKVIHEQGLVSVLKQIHDDLDAAVFDAYGWPHTLTDEEILERLVALNAERAEEERRGIIRWLRPEFQNPAGTRAATQTAIEAAAETDAAPAKPKELPKWPKELREQVSAVRDLVARDGHAAAAWSAEEIARAFKSARRPEIVSILDALTALGILHAFETPEGRRWRPA